MGTCARPLAISYQLLNGSISFDIALLNLIKVGTCISTLADGVEMSMYKNTCLKLPQDAKSCVGVTLCTM